MLELLQCMRACARRLPSVISDRRKPCHCNHSLIQRGFYSMISWTKGSPFVMPFFYATSIYFYVFFHLSDRAFGFIFQRLDKKISLLHNNLETRLHSIRCEDKFYQLEELEDSDASTTEIYLAPDRTITFGETSGPKADEIEGDWEVEDDNFVMTIRRVFGSGKRGTDMGEFSFEIVREFQGEMSMVGDSVAITGKMINKDDLLGDKDVGYFNMVDDTKERESYVLDSGKFKYEIDTTKGLRLSEILPSERSIRGMFGDVTLGNGVVGPGGLDPLEVMNALPSQLAEAFQLKDIDLLEACLSEMQDEGETEYYMNGAIDSGLWLTEEQVAARNQRLGPGGLDPEEVWQTLPEPMQEAFNNQDLELLNAALALLSNEEAEYHMKRCEDAGLWG